MLTCHLHLTDEEASRRKFVKNILTQFKDHAPKPSNTFQPADEDYMEANAYDRSACFHSMPKKEKDG